MLASKLRDRHIALHRARDRQRAAEFVDRLGRPPHRAQRLPAAAVDRQRQPGIGARRLRRTIEIAQRTGMIARAVIQQRDQDQRLRLIARLVEPLEQHMRALQRRQRLGDVARVGQRAAQRQQQVRLQLRSGGR
ncbi:MAG: hypothetical protein PGN14_08750 [Sphingomonas adhaesiva]